MPKKECLELTKQHFNMNQAKTQFRFVCVLFIQNGTLVQIQNAVI